MMFKKRLNSSGLLKDVTIIASGSVIAQGLNILITPILSRLYSPEDFGVLAAFIAIMSIAIPLSTLRYYLAIALPKSENHARSLLILALAIQLVFILLISLLLFIFGNSMLSFFKIEKIIPYKMLLPIAVLGASTYATLVQWAIREKFFWVISRTKVSQSFSGGLAKIGLGMLGYKPLGLVVGTIIGQTGGIVSLLQALFSKKGYPTTNRTVLKRVAIKYRKFAFFDTPSAVINVTGDQIIPILVFSFYGAKVAGFFSIAQQLLVIPSVFIGDAIGQVFLQRATIAKHEGELERLSLNTYLLLLQIGTLPTLFIALFAPSIFSAVLGKEWVSAGYYARCLIPFAIFSFAFSPVSLLFNINNKQDLALKLESCYFLVKVCAFLGGSTFLAPLFSVLVFSISSSILVFVRTIFALKTTGVKPNILIARMFYLLIIPISGSIFILIINYLNLGHLATTIPTILLFIHYLYKTILFLKISK